MADAKTYKELQIPKGAAKAFAAALAEQNVPIFEYSPKTAKRAAVGRGDASKEQVALMMSSICRIDISGVPDDATDALALALCHANASAGKEVLSLTGTQV